MATTAASARRAPALCATLGLLLALAGCGGGGAETEPLIAGEPHSRATTALAIPIGESAVPGGNLLANPSFEQPLAATSVAAAMDSMPTQAGFWRGDPAFVVGTEMGIVPHDGTAMLKFAATSRGDTFATTTAEQWQLVELGSHRETIAAGGLRARLDGWFNRVAGETADRRFDLRLMAFDGDPADLPARYAASHWLAEATAPLVSAPNQWQPATAILTLPPRTTYLLVEIVASEDVHDDGEGAEFAGHYADDLSLVLLPAR